MPLPPNIPQCEHIKTNGIRCGSPAVKRNKLCYFHQRIRPAAPAAEAPLELPLLEDANAIQVALQRVCEAIIHNRIDTKRAGLLLYALQTAALNLKRVDLEPAESLARQNYPAEVAQAPKEHDPDDLFALLMKQIADSEKRLLAAGIHIPEENRMADLATNIGDLEARAVVSSQGRAARPKPRDLAFCTGTSTRPFDSPPPAKSAGRNNHGGGSLRVTRFKTQTPAQISDQPEDAFAVVPPGL